MTWVRHISRLNRLIFFVTDNVTLVYSFYLTLNTDPNNHAAANLSCAMDDIDDLGVIMAKGFPWKVTKADVLAFFSDVSIIGEEDGIQIRKNGPMEVIFFVESKKDLRNALAHNRRPNGSRTIHGGHCA